MIAFPCILILSGFLRYKNILPFRTIFLIHLVGVTASLTWVFLTSIKRFRCSMKRSRLVLILIGCICVGISFRISHFDTFPPDNGQLVEEYQTGSYALLSMESSELDVFFPIVNLIAETGFRLFGIGLDGCDGHLLSGVFWVFVSSLLRPTICFVPNLPCFFLFHMSFVSNAFLAGSSRISMETMSPVTTLTFVCMALSRYYSRRDTTTLILTGLALGLLSTEYFSFKLISLTFFIFLLWSCIARSGQSPHGKNGPISEGN